MEQFACRAGKSQFFCQNRDASLKMSAGHIEAEKRTPLIRADRAFLLLVIVGALLAVLRCISLIGLPYQIDYGEGLLLEGAQRVHHSQALYPKPFAFPVVLHVYGPVAYATVALVLPGGEASFPAGRGLVLMCSILVALLLGTILKRLTGSPWVGFAFGLLLLTLPAFRFWLYLLRADLIGVLFSVIGVTLYLLQEKRWTWSIPFFALALFCKYSLLAAPVAMFVDLMVNRKVKQAIGFAVGLASACLLVFLVLQSRTDGWFAFHMFSTHRDPYSLVQFFTLAALVAASAPVVTALAVWYAAQDLRGTRRGFPPIYLVVSLITALTAGKLGSTTNHFVEWMVACCLCAGLGYFLLLSRYPARVTPITVLLSISMLAGVIAENRSSVQPSSGLTECGRAYQRVRDSQSSAILSQSLGPVLAAGKPVLVSDPFVYGELVQHGAWPDRRVEQLVSEKYFGLVVMVDEGSRPTLPGAGIWPASLLDAISTNYHIVDRFACRDAGLILEPVSPRPTVDVLPGPGR